MAYALLAGFVQVEFVASGFPPKISPKKSDFFHGIDRNFPDILWEVFWGNMKW